MIALGILLAHLLGDYVLQNDWMAQEKTKDIRVALLHGIVYSVPYWALVILMFGITPRAWLAGTVIAGTHMIIDHLRLAKPVIWALNQLGPRRFRYSWVEARGNNGYAAGKPVWMSIWLMIIVDNTIHLLINTGAILWL